MNDKETLIAEYAALERSIVEVTHERDTDTKINELEKQYKNLGLELIALKQPYGIRIQDVKTRQNEIKDELKLAWGTGDKMFKCAVGTATLRTTKSLVITDKANMIQRLSEILTGHLIEACVYIKTFDLTRARKLKDAGLIDDKIAHYEEKQNVVIKVAEED